MERLQKVIAKAGICSRRKAEELIKEGKVKVNGIVVDELGTKVKDSDEIIVNGQRIAKEEKVYYVINKPKGCLCANSDPYNRKTVFEYLPDDKRLFTVGRLDFDTSGVLLITNDGEFSNMMIHPRYHLDKTYQINLDGILSEDDIKRLRDGLKTNDTAYLPAKVSVKQKDYTRGRTLLELTIQEGKNHQVKNMMEALGHKVRKLNRSKFGCVGVEGMRPGEYRPLKPHERKLLIMLSKDGENK